MYRRHYVFRLSVRECVRASVCARVRTGVRPVSTISYNPMDNDDIVQATNKLIKFLRQRLKIKVATRSHVKNFGTPYLLNDLKYHNQV